MVKIAGHSVKVILSFFLLLCISRTYIIHIPMIMVIYLFVVVVVFYWRTSPIWL